jgi:hypothetical protein
MAASCNAAGLSGRAALSAWHEHLAKHRHKTMGITMVA